MSEAELVDESVVPDGVVLVAVAELSTSRSFRAGGVCGEQVDRLVDLGGSWPPVLIDRARNVIDGGHRVAAARRLGLARISAVYFEGDSEEAFVEFVRRNVAHGLMLTLGERKDAAARVLGLHPGWSDRRVAATCALSPKTVGRLRLTVVTDPGAMGSSEVREGRDHRMRPARRGSVRGRVLEALRLQPDASLRTIAAAAGASPETVRLVRLNLAAASQDEPGEPPVPGVVPTVDAALPTEGWQSDAALESSGHGPDLLGWLDQTRIEPAHLEWVESIPLSRVYIVAEEARRRSELWLDFAKALEARPARAH